MQLKLAEYRGNNFIKFITKLPKKNYYGDGAKRYNYNADGFVNFKNKIKIVTNGKIEVFQKDKIDPSNRFLGLFDRLTYGNGRFVLNDFYIENKTVCGKDFILRGGDLFVNATGNDNFYTGNDNFYVGNIFENPEIMKVAKSD